ncbi:toll/interleukin-1 receptor domain-containing protein [Arthrobacter oryzae]|uniref:TIR domain-containing protein n=1 Tax=Arthrobacter oryzae TaxID=409290 RepID=A0A495EUQ6_9MICC|nr:toll/interleukin-1 receptor domain-containing protein [Arthrobacter oryzae]RKR20512.1 TIR domain-containing protein [Arthrobacter oryzae]
MSEVVAKAFLSYAHVDNEREDGRIRRLAELLRAEFEFLTGETIDIFVDSAEIRWGHDFRAQLDEALQNTTFFIPVLTPTYFLREECRKEMVQFVSSARSLGLQELLMSIRYTPVPDLREGSTDELKDIAARMQFEPWDDVRLLEETSSPYRTRIHRLATRLVELTRDLEARPVHLASNPKRASVDVIAKSAEAGEPPSAAQRLRPAPEEEEADDAPGFLELMADFQPVADEWTNTLTTLGPAVGEFGELFSASSKEMEKANKKPNAFAAKIVIARQLAKDAAAPLETIEHMSKEYSTSLLRMDPIIRAVLEVLAHQEEDAGNGDAVAGIRRLIDSSREAMATITEAADAAKANAGMSRDLRPLLRRFETALRNVVDGQDLIDGWEPLLEGAAKRLPSLEVAT